MTKTPEQLDELIRRVHQHEDISSWQKDPSNSGSINLVSILSNIPKAKVPKPDLMRVRSTILDRISLPYESDKSRGWFGFNLLQGLPRFVRLTGGIVGAFTIMLSLTIGTAVAALESVPGQTIYPIKKIVENVQLRLASSDEEKANLQIKFANNRVDELETILQKQKAGEASEEDVKKVVENTMKDVQKTTESVTSQNPTDPQIALLNKIVNLSTKQTAVIQAAQVESQGDVKVELDKALESSLITTEQAIDNIEKAGLVVEDNLMVHESDAGKNVITAAGELTAVNSNSISVGTSQFLLTSETEYVSIKPVDLKKDLAVKITAEVRDKKTYAIKVESLAIPETPAPTAAENNLTPSPTTETPVPQTP